MNFGLKSIIWQRYQFTLLLLLNYVATVVVGTRVVAANVVAATANFVAAVIPATANVVAAAAKEFLKHIWYEVFEKPHLVFSKR